MTKTDHPDGVYEAESRQTKEEARIVRAYARAFEAATNTPAVTTSGMETIINAAASGCFSRVPDLEALFRRVIDRYRSRGYAISAKAVVAGAVQELARAAPMAEQEQRPVRRVFPRYLGLADARLLAAKFTPQADVYDIVEIAKSTWADRSGYPMDCGERLRFDAAVEQFFGVSSEVLEEEL